MNENALAGIRRLFLDRYDDLKLRLSQRLGSADLADDAMQDTWLRLERTESIGIVRSPWSYLFRVALNVAEDRSRTERRQRISAIEIESLLELPDHSPTPEAVVLARSDLKAFQEIMAEMPERRREIFLAARIGNVPHQEIAGRLGVSRALVTKELRLALEHCLARRRQLKE